MIDLLKFLYSLHDKEEKNSFISWIFFPLLFSMFLGIFLLFFPTQNDSAIIHLIYSYVIIWVFTLLFLFISFYFLYYHCKKDRRFGENKNEIRETITNLIDKRSYTKIKFIEFFDSIIPIIYLLELFITINFIKNDIDLLSPIFLFTIFLLGLMLSKVKNLFTGFQEGWFERYSLLIFLSSASIFYLWAIFLRQEDIFRVDLNFLFLIIIPFIPVLIEKIIIRPRLKQKKENIGFSHYMNSTTLIMEFIFSFLFVFIILSIVIVGYLLGLFVITKIFSLLIITLFFLLPSILIIMMVCYTFLSDFSYSFVKNIFDWRKFFDCYNSPSIEHLLDSSDDLIKAEGRCRAISIKETYRKKIDSYNQHIYFELNSSKEDIDVICLEEKNPFYNSKKELVESDKIMLIGKIKSALDDEYFYPNDNRINDYILAYHVEKILPKKEISFSKAGFPIELDNLSDSQKQIFINNYMMIIEKLNPSFFTKLYGYIFISLGIFFSHILRVPSARNPEVINFIKKDIKVLEVLSQNTNDKYKKKVILKLIELDKIQIKISRSLIDFQKITKELNKQYSKFKLKKDFEDFKQMIILKDKHLKKLNKLKDLVKEKIKCQKELEKFLKGKKGSTENKDIYLLIISIMSDIWSSYISTPNTFSTITYLAFKKSTKFVRGNMLLTNQLQKGVEKTERNGLLYKKEMNKLITKLIKK